MFILEYFLWHYLKAPKKILQIWGNYLKFFVVYFIPIPQLLKTLLAPWKRDLTDYGRGFELKKYLETLAFNLISRLMGATIRLAVIIFALILEMLTLALGAGFLIFWIFWPFFLMSSIISSVYFLSQKNTQAFITPAIIIFDLLTILIFILFFQKSKQKMPNNLSFEEIMEQDWASIIWSRLGISQEDTANIAVENEGSLDDFLKQKNIDKKDFLAVLEWETTNQTEKAIRKKFWEKQNLFGKGGIGRTWLYGWTNTLDSFSSELTGFDDSAHLIGRQNELDAMERGLCKTQQGNVLLIGDPGVGKKTLVQQFAKLVSQGKVSPALAFSRMLNLDLNGALSGLTTEGDIKAKLMKIFSEAQHAGNIILVIDEFHNFVSPDIPSQEISAILLPFIEGSYFKLITLTTYEGLHTRIEKNPGLLKMFEKVEVKEPNQEETMSIMQDSVINLEKRTGKRITIQALKEIIKTTNRYITDVPFPEKALDLLEETTIYVSSNTIDSFVMPSHVDLVISQKTEMPIGELQSQEKQKLLNLEDFLHQRVINQNLAIQEISSAMRRSRLGIASQNRPMGTFLFLGPTGVGKTETAKALAEAYFGSEDRMIRLDMSEYQGVSAVERIIGSAATQTPGILTTAVRENPFSLLLLDEIEKADANILNLFLQVLDEGWMTDAFGRKINFRNLIIIATSNASAELIRQMVKQGEDPSAFKQKVLDFIQQNAIFKPEFLNRFDGVIVFKPLSQENILQIAQLLLNSLANRLSSQEIIFKPTKELVEKIGLLGYEPQNGARAMRRVIQDKIEDLIAKKMLAGKITKQVPFEIKAEEIS